MPASVRYSELVDEDFAVWTVYCVCLKNIGFVEQPVSVNWVICHPNCAAVSWVVSCLPEEAVGDNAVLVHGFIVVELPEGGLSHVLQ